MNSEGVIVSVALDLEMKVAETWQRLQEEAKGWRLRCSEDMRLFLLSWIDSNVMMGWALICASLQSSNWLFDFELMLMNPRSFIMSYFAMCLITKWCMQLYSTMSFVYLPEPLILINESAEALHFSLCFYLFFTIHRMWYMGEYSTFVGIFSMQVVYEIYVRT